MMKTKIQLISPELFAEPGVTAYAILDGASVTGLVGKLQELAPKHECLYRGELAPDMAEVAPYLVQLDAESEFTDWVLNQGWGNHWGVFVVSSADLFSLRQHFRKFLTVYDSSGKPMLFRYYDPRVLSVYLPTCTAEEFTSLFGPVSRFLMESEGAGEMVMFENQSGKLSRKKKVLADG